MSNQQNDIIEEDKWERLAELEGKILGLNNRCYPDQDSFPGPVIRAVLVAGAIGDYACYVGAGNPAWIARHGDKLSFIEARCHFPYIEEEKYRT